MRVDPPTAAVLVLALTACAGSGPRLAAVTAADLPPPPRISIPSVAKASSGMPVHCPASVPYMPVVLGRDTDPFMPRGSREPSPCSAESRLRMAARQPGDSAGIVKPLILPEKARVGRYPR